MKVAYYQKALKTKVCNFFESRLFKKHNVSSWREYHLKYDPDFSARASTIRKMFHGYPYIAEITDSRSIKAHAHSSLEDGFSVLNCWLENNCRGKARMTLERTVEFDTGTRKDWYINSLGSRDSVFVAFQDERDFLIFTLKWVPA